MLIFKAGKWSYIEDGLRAIFIPIFFVYFFLASVIGDQSKEKTNKNRHSNADFQILRDWRNTLFDLLFYFPMDLETYYISEISRVSHVYEMLCNSPIKPASYFTIQINMKATLYLVCTLNCI